MKRIPLVIAPEQPNPVQRLQPSDHLDGVVSVEDFNELTNKFNLLLNRIAMQGFYLGPELYGTEGMQ